MSKANTLGTPEQCANVRTFLKAKFGTLENAAQMMGVSKFTLSRVLGGATTDLETVIRILIGTGHLEKRKFIMPRIDLDTFYVVNKLRPVVISSKAPQMRAKGKQKGGKRGR